MEKRENLNKKLPEDYGTPDFDFSGEESRQKLEELNKTIDEINKETSYFKLTTKDVVLTNDGHYKIGEQIYTKDGLLALAKTKDDDRPESSGEKGNDWWNK